MGIPPKSAPNKNANRPLPTPPGAAPTSKGKAASNGGIKSATASTGGLKSAGGRGPGPAGADANGPVTSTGKDKKPAALNGGASATKKNTNVAGGAKGSASASAGSASASNAGGSAATQKATTGGSMSANLKPPTSKIPSSNANRPLPTPPGKQTPKTPKPAKQESEAKGNQSESNFDPKRADDPAFKQWQDAAKHAEQNAKKYAINPGKKK